MKIQNSTTVNVNIEESNRKFANQSLSMAVIIPFTSMLNSVYLWMENDATTLARD